MNSRLDQINKEVYERCQLKISNIQLEHESKAYDACRFDLSGRCIISRSSKITPKKIGQFVTYWKRNASGTIEPLDVNDDIDFYIVNVRAENRLGQFVFPKSVLMEKRIISTATKEGKRGFRVYPIWDKPKNAQAERTQKWQLVYFYEIHAQTDLKKVTELYD